MKREMVIVQNINTNSVNDEIAEIGTSDMLDILTANVKYLYNKAFGRELDPDEILESYRTFNVTKELNEFLIKDCYEPHKVVAIARLPFETSDEAQELINFVRTINVYTSDHLDDAIAAIGGQMIYLPDEELNW